MVAFSWNTLLLLTVTLLAALGLQAASIKIMINLSQPSEPAIATETRVAPSRSSLPTRAIESAPSASLPAERPAASPTPVAGGPNPEALLADPPSLALPPKPEPQHQQPNPEARQVSVTAPPSPTVAQSSPPVTPSVEVPAPPAVSDPPPVAVAAPATRVTLSPEASAPTTPTAPTTNGFQEAAWLKARDPRHYTVQVYSGKEMNTLREISVAVATTDPQAYFSTTSRSGSWHLLVVGDYADSATAQAAATKMVARLPALKPWVRRFDEVQAKLR